MSATLWENAPATREIKLAPVRAIVLAQEQRSKWTRCIAHIDALLPMDEVCAEDKLRLRLERMAAVVGQIACDRMIAEAEKESARQIEKFQLKEGWRL